MKLKLDLLTPHAETLPKEKRITLSTKEGSTLGVSEHDLYVIQESYDLSDGVFTASDLLELLRFAREEIIIPSENS